MPRPSVGGGYAQWQQQRAAKMLSDLEPKIDVQIEQDDDEPSVFKLTVSCLRGTATDVWAKWMVHFSASQHWDEGLDFLGQTRALRDGETIQHEIRIVPEKRLLIPLEAPQDVDVDVWVGFKTLWGTTRWASTSWSAWPLPP